MDGSENNQTERERLAEWHRYYSAKRIGQQWTQVHLLRDLPVQTVLEVGPYMGLATALMDNAGYDVTTLDDGRIVLYVADAAALPEVVLTVWTNVFERGRLAAGESEEELLPRPPGTPPSLDEFPKN